MAQLVLGLWVATAFMGAYMFTFTTGAARSRAEALPGQPVSRLPPLALFVHPLLGLTSLGLWIGYLAAGRQSLAWATFVVLLVGAGVGDLLVVRTLKDKSHSEPTAEHRIPTVAIAIHGVLAVALIVSVLVVALGFDSQEGEDDADFGRTAPALVTPGR